LGKSAIGIEDEAVRELVRLREEVYARFFGENAVVSHEVLPQIPHIDVRTYGPGHREREYFTLVTSGMSNAAMDVPARATHVSRRVELILYCSEPKQEYIDTMRWMAHFPHNAKAWIGAGHTMPNGNPPEPFWGSEALDTFLFMPSIVRPDSGLPGELSFDGEPVEFLWLVPLTSAESDLKLDKGFGAILDLFLERQHPVVFNPRRTSYV
jgi:hypothetical protein